MRIYIAGPYSSVHRWEIRNNIARADRAARVIAAKGHTPFCPHTHTCNWQYDDRFTHDDFMRIDFEWLEQCHAILYLGPSPGADMELKHAQEIELTVFRSVQEIPDAHQEGQL